MCMHQWYLVSIQARKIAGRIGAGVVIDLFCSFRGVAGPMVQARMILSFARVPSSFAPLLCAR